MIDQSVLHRVNGVTVQNLFQLEPIELCFITCFTYGKAIIVGDFALQLCKPATTQSYHLPVNGC